MFTGIIEGVGRLLDEFDARNPGTSFREPPQVYGLAAERHEQLEPRERLVLRVRNVQPLR